MENEQNIFNVGDWVIGVTHDYSFTGFGVICKVTNIQLSSYVFCDDISVMPLNDTISYPVRSECFRKLTESEIIEYRLPLIRPITPDRVAPIENVVRITNCHDCCNIITTESAILGSDDNLRCDFCNRLYQIRSSEPIDEDSYSDDYGDIPCRSYDSIFVSRKKNNLETNIIQSSRGFGVEIELYARTYGDIQEVYDEISDSIGMSGDGSLDSRGFELQFPLRNGKLSESLVNETCKTLIDYKCFVDGTCGYHLHLQRYPNEYKFPFMQRLMFVATIFDDVIMSFLPKTRRENRYCQSVKRFLTLDRVLECRDRDDLEAIWYRDNKRSIKRRKQGHYDDARYFGFNFHAYFSKMKHLEIRHHTGTINAEKILYWANLHTLLLDAIKKSVVISKDIEKWDQKDVLIKLNDTGTINDKTNYLFDFIGLSQSSRDHFLFRQSQFNQPNQQ